MVAEASGCCASERQRRGDRPPFAQRRPHAPDADREAGGDDRGNGDEGHAIHSDLLWLCSFVLQGLARGSGLGLRVRVAAAM